MLNHLARKYTDSDLFNEHARLVEIFKKLDSEGKKIKGRIRENVANSMNISTAQVGKIENIKNNAIDEIVEAVEDGRLSISTANEIAKCDKNEQHKLVDGNDISSIKSSEVKHRRDSKKETPPITVDEQSAEQSINESASENSDTAKAEKDTQVSGVRFTKKEVDFLKKNIESFYTMLHFCNEDEDYIITGIISKLENAKGE